jgi:SdrD B-like domain
MTIYKIKARTIIGLFALAAMSAASAYTFLNKASAAGFSGAIYTTTFDGQSVNENNYSNKNAVYLNGGPQNQNASGLPDGTYYFQVTDPSGATLLSTDPAVCRQLLVANGRVVAAEGPACQHPTGIPNSSNGTTPVKLAPFNDTPNNGGQYKVWLIRQAANTIVAADGMHLNFNNNNAKTDNFKVTFVPCTNCGPTSLLGGKKFYDANGNTLFDEGEAPVEGVQFVITVTTSEGTTTNTVTTNEAGNWSFEVPTGAEYEIGEYLPYTSSDDESGSYWSQTAPVADSEGFQGYRGTASGDHFGLNFGDICYRPNGIASATPCGVSYEPPPPPPPPPTPTPCEDCPTSVLSGQKFYDANGNGRFDEGEVTVQGVRIAVILTIDGATTTTTVTTDESGNWSLAVPTGAQYTIGEYVPDTNAEEEPGSFWEQTAPAASDEGFRGYSGTASEDQSGLNFGDICYHPDSEGNPVASGTPCTVSYPRVETPPPTPTPTPDPRDNQ